MSVNRRRFLQDGALAAAACAATPLLSWGQQRRENSSSEFEIGPDGVHGHGFAAGHLPVSRPAFEGLVGDSFKVSPRSGNGSPTWMRLNSVEDLPALAPVNPASMAVPPKQPQAPVPTTTGYMLTFSAPGTSLSQDTYIFENGRMGKFAMFVVPGAGGSYTAVYNLLDAAPHNGRFITPSHEHSGGAAPGVANTKGKAPGSENLGGSTAASPAQEQVEPALRDRFKAKLPE